MAGIMVPKPLNVVRKDISLRTWGVQVESRVLGLLLAEEFTALPCAAFVKTDCTLTSQATMKYGFNLTLGLQLPKYWELGSIYPIVT